MVFKQDGGHWRAQGIACPPLEGWRKTNGSIDGQPLRLSARV